MVQCGDGMGACGFFFDVAELGACGVAMAIKNLKGIAHAQAQDVHGVVKHIVGQIEFLADVGEWWGAVKSMGHAAL